MSEAKPQPRPRSAKEKSEGPPPPLGLLSQDLALPEVGSKLDMRRGIRGVLAKWFLPYR
jgi:hypothetical protein